LCVFFSGAVYGAGVAAAAATILLGIFSLLSVFQIAMVVSRDTVVMRYSKLVVSKLVLALLAGICTQNPLSINICTQHRQGKELFLSARVALKETKNSN
jgi:hypothetical protein